MARGRWALATAQRDRRRAVELAGVSSHLSAAQHHGWPVKDIPDRPRVTVRRKRRLDADTAATVHVAYADLSAAETADGVTAHLRTVLDCARRLPFDEALAVADSALRAGDVSAEELIASAESARGPGARAVRQVAAHADARAANPFESVLRAIAIEVGLDVVPQHPLVARKRTWHPDLVDVRRRLVIEADSHEFHTGREEHGRDCVRYTALSVAGWTVLRFTWEQVMLSASYVRDVLREVKKMPAAA
jgi:very-short-patch-repair endonuclease